ncbi:sperm motility kinase X-like isoform X2 [Sigmodon hispidus]
MTMTRKVTTSSFERHILDKDYYVIGTLGKGSLGKVKLALHLMTQTLVAIKILKRGTSTDPLISSETELLKALQHPHITQLLQVIQTKHKIYLVMECASRGPLLKQITKCGHLEEEEARTLFRELTLAIKYIHSHNIAHRDIKPENILVDSEGHIKLSDFGLGKRFASGEKAKGFWGTMEYCAPEVFGHTQYDGLPTDIWSLGVVLYLLVTGYLPFRETEHSKMKSLILSRNCCIPHHLSPELQDLLNQLMTVDPTKRPSIMEVMAHPWLHHEEDTLISSAEIPKEPDPNLSFQMFSMGYKIQEIKDALNQKEYTRAMATYLILQKKQRQHRTDHDGGQSDTMPAKSPNLSLPLRRGTSAPTLPTFAFPTLSELPGDEKKGCRAHSVPPTLSSLKSVLPEKNDPQHESIPHSQMVTFREIEGSIVSTSSSTMSLSPKTSLEFVSSKVTSYEITQDVSTESFETLDPSNSTSSQESISRSHTSSEQAQGESTCYEYLQDSSSSSPELSQDVSRVPQRQPGRKGLKKRISQALHSLCCCDKETIFR